jgi:hypothetical protein
MRWNTYMVAGYLVPMDRRAGVFNFRGELWARLALPSWHGHPAGVPIRIIPLHSQDVFIGRHAWRLKATMRAPSGFTMGGPGQAVLDPREGVARKTITAYYPAEMMAWTGPSLAYEDSPES